ncbi:YHS domain-containing protein [Thermosediminibacter litoriperuensis]|uniref:Cu+-exporting ATPase n=1 Tax=Thermosediminibacter litoriperuensis TaxID=291989 RepID=A0A5S5AYT4_9FIRM|nr:YHS domain-containing protein [Thermosediminibacter litoriperuensis]TYP57637.1 Cu+-exporting ATPase [Thermosediminibacter litoriperuensis]
MDFSDIILLLIGAGLLFLMMRRGGCCGGHGGHGGHYAGGHDHYRTDGNGEYAVDPVCGMRVSKKNAITRQINGKTYYFCSEECANSFRG